MTRDPATIMRAYWSKAAAERPVEEAVHPSTTWAGYHAWTRRMLQTWTLDRMRAMGPRFERALDLGCGYGDWTEQFAPMCDEIYACDIAPSFVAEAQRRLPNAQVECADLRSYVIPSELDFIYIGAVLMYVPDDAAWDLLVRLRDAVRPGALVIWRDYGAFNLGRGTVNASDDFYSVHRSPRELRSLATSAGFRVVELRSSPSIYGEVMGGRMWKWPCRALWRLASATWLRTSYSIVLRPETALHG